VTEFFHIVPIMYALTVTMFCVVHVGCDAKTPPERIQTNDHHTVLTPQQHH
jgi:hypothetical protein